MLLPFGRKCIPKNSGNSKAVQFLDFDIFVPIFTSCFFLFFKYGKEISFTQLVGVVWAATRLLLREMF